MKIGSAESDPAPGTHPLYKPPVALNTLLKSSSVGAVPEELMPSPVELVTMLLNTGTAAPARLMPPAPDPTELRSSVLPNTLPLEADETPKPPHTLAAELPTIRLCATVRLPLPKMPAPNVAEFHSTRHFSITSAVALVT